MLDSPEHINTSSSQQAQKLDGPQKRKKFTTEQAFEKAGSGFKEFKSKFSPAQYKEFVNNITHAVLTEIKQQQEDAMKALRKLKKSETGDE